MHTTRTLCQLAVLTSCLAVPSRAMADVVLLSPLIAQRGVDEEQISDLFTLISSELEFMSNVEEVIELSPVPSMLDIACLDSTRCLGDLTRRAEADAMLTGSIQASGQDLVLDLLYYDAGINRVLRRNTFTIGSDASDIIARITPILVEIVTGVTQATQEVEQEGLDNVDFAADDTLADDEPAPDTRPVGRTIVPPPAPADPPPPRDPEPAAEEFDPSAISFGDSASDITFGGSGSDITYNTTPTTITPPPTPPPRAEPIEDFEEEEEEDDEDPPPSTVTRREPVDLDDDVRRSDSSSTRSTTTRRTDPKKEYRRVHINLRGGYSNYGVFHFGVAQAEVQVRLASGLFIVAGVDGAFVNRELPEGTPLEIDGVQRRACISPPRATVDGRIIELNCIWPIHAGFVYRFKAGIAQPYIGADAIFSQYYQEPETRRQAWAAGARARLGTDIFFSKNVGLNLDVALGFWSGKDWELVDPRVKKTGVLPTLGAGFVFAF